MKQKILLSLIITSFIISAKAQKTIAYAITGATKGSSNWAEVRQIDFATGQELKTIYQKTQEPEILNARTGKAIVKKDAAVVQQARLEIIEKMKNGTSVPGQHFIREVRVQSDKPFSTNSAALAYDKKHDRLYYTPMGINQLRYIDLKSKTPKIYYFEDEQFGALTGPGNVSNQVTRMVIGADGNGYALTNNANHLIQFTTNKKATITDLGALNDDVANGNNSVHSQNIYGGDMIADKSGNFYLIGANHSVYKIILETKVAVYKGSIQGLPKSYSTNGAAVEEGTKIILASSNSTEGYYRFDLTTMAAEKITSGELVFNASDLANGNLITEKKNKKEETAVQQPEVQKEIVTEQLVKPTIAEIISQSRVSVFPNPVTTGTAKVSLENVANGKYIVQLMDLSGKIISSQPVTVNYKTQVENLKIPQTVSKGNYLIKIVDETNKVVNTAKMIVQ